MRRYIWFNPVTLQLYNQEELEAAVCRQGFEPVQCQQDHITAVKEKYHNAIAQAAGVPVIDMRCPEAARQVKLQWGDKWLLFPEIHPILIHCAAELQRRYAEPDSMVFITTPCRALRDYGNALGLPNTKFYTWNEFAEKYGIELPRRQLLGSPIPPGFFDDFGEGVRALAAWEEIQRFFQNEAGGSPKIIEMLYCKNGCHNGDGILEEETT